MRSARTAFAALCRSLLPWLWACALGPRCLERWQAHKKLVQDFLRPQYETMVFRFGAGLPVCAVLGDQA